MKEYYNPNEKPKRDPFDTTCWAITIIFILWGAFKMCQ